MECYDTVTRYYSHVVNEIHVQASKNTLDSPTEATGEVFGAKLEEKPD